MKSRSKELLDRAIAATISAIEIYNKPDFLYREEAFAVLAINGWELLAQGEMAGRSQQSGPLALRAGGSNQNRRHQEQETEG